MFEFISVNHLKIPTAWIKYFMPFYRSSESWNMGHLSQVLVFLSLSVLGYTAALKITERVECDTSIEGDIYGFSATPLNGSLFNSVDFEDFRDQVRLSLNLMIKGITSIIAVSWQLYLFAQMSRCLKNHYIIYQLLKFLSLTTG